LEFFFFIHLIQYSGFKDIQVLKRLIPWYMYRLIFLSVIKMLNFSPAGAGGVSPGAGGVSSGGRGCYTQW
jgi:hypothetical protein